MQEFTVTRDQAVAAVRAMRAIAAADGTVGGLEDSLLRGAARALEVEDAFDVAPLTPQQVAEAVPDPVARVRIVQSLEMMVIMDGRVEDAELAACAAYAEALGIDADVHAALRANVHRTMRLMKLDLQRRTPPASAHVTEPARAWPYKQLGLLPEGTFGRAFWTHMTERQFPFPGEYLDLPDDLVRHDVCHVLAGFGTDAAGEAENAAFVAGVRKQDPFAWLFMVAVHTELDRPVFPTSDPTRTFLGMDPDRVIVALARGQIVKRDLFDAAWDPWKEFPRALADVREDLGIAHR